MNKIIRTIACAITLCFLSTSVFGVENIIKTKITLTPDSPIFYENYIGIETPTKGQVIKLHVEARYNGEQIGKVNIKNLDGFKLIKGPETEYEDNQPKANAFTLRAPEKEGNYIIVFEGQNSTGSLFHFDTEIRVVESDQFQNWLRIGFVAGVIILATAVVVIISSSSRK
jgi:hypothetical protein